MKRSDSGDFCVLYVEPDDEKTSLFQKIMEQKKPIVIMLAEQARVFQRPEDFAELKHIRRHLDMPVLFVSPSSERLVHLAGRNGFPVYLSMDALVNALKMGQVGRPRGVARKTIPLGSGQHAAVHNNPSSSDVISTENRRDAIVGARFISPSGSMPGPSGSMPHRSSVISGPSSPVPRRSSPSQTDILTVPTMPLISAPAPSPEAQPRVNRLVAGVLILLLIALVTAVLGYFLVASHSLPTDASAVTNVVLGHVTFVSSNQISESSSQGLNDKVLVELNKVPPPATGKSYYAWLLGDKSQSDMKAMLLGTLPVTNGHAQLLYPGDANHTNLLETNSRFLVTEEDAGTAPLTPSPDYSTWRYYGEFSQIPINASGNTQHFSYLDHLRHLLAADPTLDELELPGGLNTWLYRNVSKVQEWTGSMRDQWQESKDIGFVRQQALSTLTYLDGVSFVAQDLPPDTVLNVNEQLARIGLLDVDGPAQDPPGYLSHVSQHLYGLLEANTATPALRAKVAAIVAALDNVKTWLIQVHHDALQIINMSDKQLQQPGTLTVLNDMVFNATNAFTGYADPVSGQMREGVTWIHDQIQSLAILDVEHITVADERNIIGPVQMVPNLNVRSASVRGGKV